MMRRETRPASSSAGSEVRETGTAAAACAARAAGAGLRIGSGDFASGGRKTMRAVCAAAVIPFCLL